MVNFGSLLLPGVLEGHHVVVGSHELVQLLVHEVVDADEKDGHDDEGDDAQRDEEDGQLLFADPALGLLDDETLKCGIGGLLHGWYYRTSLFKHLLSSLLYDELIKINSKN